MKEAKDYSNSKIGKLFVICRAADKIGGQGQKIVQWKCRCECGDIVYRRPVHLKRGNCRCKTCKAAEDAKKFGHGEIRQHHWYTTKRQADLRNIKFDVSVQYVWDLFEAQGRCCALSGLPISFAKSKQGHAKGETTASLDRIDSSKGYEVGNLQWLHKWVNLMKSDFTQQEFIDFCRLVTEHNHAKSASSAQVPRG